MRKEISAFLIVAAAFLLSAATCAPPSTDIQVHCVPLKTWAPADQKALADALAPIPESSPIWALAKDWEMQRAAIKACNQTVTTP